MHVSFIDASHKTKANQIPDISVFRWQQIELDENDEPKEGLLNNRMNWNEVSVHQKR